jgi:hypothetical protein
MTPMMCNTSCDSKLTRVCCDAGGPYAWFGYGWVGCGFQFPYNATLDVDYGEPTGLCAETAPGSKVFRREWTKATIEMDCKNWNSTIEMK